MDCNAPARAKVLTGNKNDPMKDRIFDGGGQFRRSVFRKLEEWEFCKRAMPLHATCRAAPVSKKSESEPHDIGVAFTLFQPQLVQQEPPPRRLMPTRNRWALLERDRQRNNNPREEELLA